MEQQIRNSPKDDLIFLLCRRQNVFSLNACHFTQTGRGRGKRRRPASRNEKFNMVGERGNMATRLFLSRARLLSLSLSPTLCLSLSRWPRRKPEETCLVGKRPGFPLLPSPRTVNHSFRGAKAEGVIKGPKFLFIPSSTVQIGF